MKTRLLLLFFLLPALVWGQIAIGDGIQLTGPGYDADAVSYFLRAGVTNSAEKNRVSDFVKGLKYLGLWDSLVEAWLLRSGQNSGSGTLVQGLKGTYSGTLVNAPLWGTSGITFARASSQRMITSALPNSDYHAAVFVGTRGDASNQGIVSDTLNGGVLTRRVELSMNNFGVAGASNANGSNFSSVNVGAPVAVDNWFYAAAIQGSSLFARRDGSTATTTAMIPGGISYPVIAGANAWKYQGTAAFVAYFSSNVSMSDFSDDLRTLYKSTIGQGLPLP